MNKTEHPDITLLKSALYSPPPSAFAIAFEALDSEQRVHLLRVVAEIISHEAEIFGYRLDADRNAPVNEYSRCKTMETAAKLVAAASELLMTELVRQGTKWE